MRCLILLCVLFAWANASLTSKRQFYRLLNDYRQPEWHSNLANQWYGRGGYDNLDEYDIGDDYDYDNDYMRRDNWWPTCNRYGLDGDCTRDDTVWDDDFYGQGCVGGDCIRGDKLWDDDFYGQECTGRDCVGQDCIGRDCVRQGCIGGDCVRGDNLWSDDFDRQECIGGDCVRDDNIWTDDFYGRDENQLLGSKIRYDEEGRIGGLSALKEIEHANHKLASRLYKQTKDEKDDKNTVVSPLSIQLALSALNKGARGNTKRQIGRLIGGSCSQQERRQLFNKLARLMKRSDIGELSGFSTRINPVTIIAIDSRTPAQQLFIQKVRNQLDARVKHCNFQRQPQMCRKIINDLVARKTNMKINQIVPRDAITDNTKMVLVNALEMKAKWGRQMRNHVTKSAKFFPLETNKVKIVEVMETQGRFKYYEDELVKIVGIPTEQKEMTFYMIVPKHKDGLTHVEKQHLQDGVQLKKLLDKTDLHLRRVDVQLPKFQIKHKIDARRCLRREGVTDALDALRADFTGINAGYGDESDISYRGLNRLGGDLDVDYGMDGLVGLGSGKKLHLNKFIHQATIKVSENGITAATQLDNEYDVMNNFQRDDIFRSRLGGNWGMDDLNTYDDVRGLFGGDLLMGGKKMVKANRAFAFAVKHNPTKQLVLVGRVIDAAQKKVNQGFENIIDTMNQF